MRVGAEQIALPEIQGPAREVRHLRARLFEYHDAARHVAGHDAHLPEAVESARRGPAEVERRRADAADRLRSHEKAGEVAQVHAAPLERVGEAGAEQRVLEAAASGHADAAAVEKRAAAPARPVHL